MKIFIAYTTRNNEVTINELNVIKRFFSSFGDTFVDLIDNDSEDKQLRIEKEVASSQLLVLVETPSTHASTWVQREVKLAEDNDLNIIRISKKLILDILSYNSLRIEDDLEEVE